MRKCGGLEFPNTWNHGNAVDRYSQQSTIFTSAKITKVEKAAESVTAFARTYGRRRRDGADPVLRRSHEPESEGRKTDAYDLPATDCFRIDKVGCALCLWQESDSVVISF